MDADRERKMLTLLSDDPTLILLMKSKYTTEAMWKISIQKEPALFQYMKSPSHEMCLYALEEDGNNLRFIINNPEISLTPDMIWTAVRSYPPAIFYVPSENRTDTLKELAFDHDPSLIREFPRVRQAYIRRKIDENPAILKYLKNPDIDLVCRAIIKNPNVCAYLTEFPPKIRQIIETYYPSMVSLLPALNRDSVETDAVPTAQ